MELTRRDALVALAAASGVGVAVGGASLVGDGDESTQPTPEETPPAAVLDTLTAAAEVLFPTEVDGHAEFVETYVLGRIEGREDYRAGLVAAATDLDDLARDWQGDAFAALDPAVRDRLLRDLGVETADPDPEGPISNRVRYFVVNDLLFAFYSSPVGGELVGIENPIGHPGGTQSYQQASVDGRGGDDG
ncbi:Gluconate 2-dehydrogenase subunit 3 [Halogranum gelatinilyticum]|uniref:Gluconate 2-dehydrogenase subunit 3 n=1 Tax=Halogranum gelatinilyticum TaxID=660521 RepID=A0A1H0A2F7_9EURY|nr:gluconate 2-dehydrogenase subunit 3 family protein [Halogranum gelatinilyticum]SDN27391.1 Gluconate 2-dehydrogenase subunit 3 [Halogranum gelatinilyticum]